ncbi:undecaprenyl-diphosphate phosphatase [Limibaculum sp. M0105]|uniref:Undecaprenyl-diphosphatase n=1 Tax=Thermohalobaculum xanthum TaxID=2753746 RepID=A0A8J7SEB3_9RHOB|nr:undecaprenyl-diphosphate phosphatase [Thermohalobaculum xanthum]MBK0400562.1 undecaprenyl-diphosphate phosphatase [Thermohalobaculum xanthum]
MALFDIIMLALIQGVTEFLPISSSGHLILWPLLTGRPDQGLMMDVAVHLGTLVAVCIYFRRDVGVLARGVGHVAAGRPRTPQARMALLIGLATLPAMAAGLAIKLMGWDDGLRALAVIGWATLVGGVALWLADRLGSGRRTGEGWGLRDALLMGLAQALALVPGTSRSGVTMMAARALGFRRDEAARISLLMAVPVILAAVGLETVELARSGTIAIGAELLLGAALSCAAALGALSVMMRMFRGSWTMTPFVLYRLALGAILLTLAYG